MTGNINIRSVTDEEIDFLLEHGWVKVPGLIDERSARLLLDQAISEFGEDGRTGLGSGPIGHSQKMTVAASAMAAKKAVGHRS